MTDNSYPLVVELWENLNYTGKYICIVEDTPNLGHYNFRNISSIKIHPGPNFDPKAIIVKPFLHFSVIQSNK